MTLHAVHRYARSTVELLISDHRWIAHLASLALIALIAAMAPVGVFLLLHDGSIPRSGTRFDQVIGFSLGMTIPTSIIAMISATRVVARRPRELVDGTLFLIVAWVVPYIGIATCLGGKNLLTMRRNTTA